MIILSASVCVTALGLVVAPSLMRREKTVEELQAKVDRKMVHDIERTLEQAGPGNPCDIEVAALIQKYGIFHLLGQARLQVGIAFAIHQRIGSQCNGRYDLVQAVMPEMYLASFGYLAERTIARFVPQIARMQANVLADMFRYLCIDVEAMFATYTKSIKAYCS